MHKQLIITLIIALCSFSAYCQCNLDSLQQLALRDLPKGFIFSKGYKLQVNKGKVKQFEYTCVLNKGTTYCIPVSSADGESKGIVVRILDQMRNEIASNYSVSSTRDQEFARHMIFVCNGTGIYYLNFSFKDSKKNCGYGVMGFKLTGSK